jgi:hypothetical protein
MSIEGLHSNKADERERDEIIKDEKFISTWGNLHQENTLCILMSVSNMWIR